MPNHSHLRSWPSAFFHFLVIPAIAFALIFSGTAAAEDTVAPPRRPKRPPAQQPQANKAPDGKAKPKESPKEPTKEATRDPAKTAPEKKVSKIPLPKVENAAWEKPVPDNPKDLQAIQDRVEAVVKNAMPWTVGLIVGNARGSGVIISKEGYILTAGHVSATPNQPVQVILPDGKVLRGKALGRNTGIDSGMIKIEEGDGNWDHAEMADSSKVKQGDWCIAIGHPGGYQRGRPPVVRLGRVVSANDRVIWTDATLVGGDSGGPLFDMDGKVIAIHSRISAPTSANFHVPVDTYRLTWDRLASAEDFTDRPMAFGPAAGFFARNLPEKKGAEVTSVTENSPAHKAGLKVGDIVTKFGKKAIANCQALTDAINARDVGSQVEVEVQREGKAEKINVMLAAGYKSGPFLGIAGDTGDKGVDVDSVTGGTPAAEAKMLKGDVIVGFDGKAIKTLDELQMLIAKKHAGQTVEVEVLRDGKPVKLKVTLGIRG